MKTQTETTRKTFEYLAEAEKRALSLVALIQEMKTRREDLIASGLELSWGDVDDAAKVLHKIPTSL